VLRALVGEIARVLTDAGDFVLVVGLRGGEGGLQRALGGDVELLDLFLVLGFGVRELALLAGEGGLRLLELVLEVFTALDGQIFVGAKRFDGGFEVVALSLEGQQLVDLVGFFPARARYLSRRSMSCLSFLSLLVAG
jgi:hypothetical protein